jgi:hypothetical protein
MEGGKERIERPQPSSHENPNTEGSMAHKFKHDWWEPTWQKHVTWTTLAQWGTQGTEALLSWESELGGDHGPQLVGARMDP